MFLFICVSWMPWKPLGCLGYSHKYVIFQDSGPLEAAGHSSAWLWSSKRPIHAIWRTHSEKPSFPKVACLLPNSWVEHVGVCRTPSNPLISCMDPKPKKTTKYKLIRYFLIYPFKGPFKGINREILNKLIVGRFGGCWAHMIDMEVWRGAAYSYMLN